ncbi:MAG: 2-C-methyl-D-erythritol 4-phosphate cytidylyltransferase [Deltaproteobacteria bacterium]
MTDTEKKPWRTVAIIPSAGLGRRMGAGRKNYRLIFGKPVLAHTLYPFEACTLVDAVILVIRPDDRDYCVREVVGRYGFKKVCAIVDGGDERQDSVANGLAAIKDGTDIIVVHDGARPLITTDIIEAAINKAASQGAAIAAMPVKDTIKEASADGLVVRTFERRSLWAVQTPQVFKADILRRSHEAARKEGFYGTDEAALVERLGISVSIVAGSYENVKITTDQDLIVAEAILEKRLSVVG